MAKGTGENGLQHIMKSLACTLRTLPDLTELAAATLHPVAVSVNFPLTPSPVLSLSSYPVQGRIASFAETRGSLSFHEANNAPPSPFHFPYFPCPSQALYQRAHLPLQIAPSRASLPPPHPFPRVFSPPQPPRTAGAEI